MNKTFADTKGFHLTAARAARKITDEQVEVLVTRTLTFVWTKSADEILETLADYCRRIIDSGH
jgi:hypothetical protein